MLEINLPMKLAREGTILGFLSVNRRRSPRDSKRFRNFPTSFVNALNPWETPADQWPRCAKRISWSLSVKRVPEGRARGPLTPAVALFFLAVILTGCPNSKAALGASATNSVPIQSYMRVARPDSNTVALQIAVRRFAPQKARGPTVWLSGASHIGESNYFASL